MRSSLTVLIGFGFIVVEACGGSTGSSTGGTGGSGGTSPGGSCPSAPPADGTNCTPPWTPDGGSPKVHCSWGDDPRAGCRTTATCLSGTWKLKTPDATACSTPIFPPGCLTPPPADTTVCSDQNLSCWYDDGTHCWCSGCKGGSGYPSCQTINPPEWYCDTPPSGCPKTLPQAGSACSTPGTKCGRDCDLGVVCAGGVWQWLASSCPVCAAPNTPVATPNGERPIASLEVGDLVYSVDHDAVVVVPLLRVGRTKVAVHRVVRVTLTGGAVLEMSPGHPTADGRSFGELVPGAAFDAAHRVESAELVPYRYDATYDVLPASSTGTYFAAGAQVGSTLFAAGR